MSGKWIKIPKKEITFGDLYVQFVNTKDPMVKKDLELKIKIKIDEMFESNTSKK